MWIMKRIIGWQWVAHNRVRLEHAVIMQAGCEKGEFNISMSCNKCGQQNWGTN